MSSRAWSLVLRADCASGSFHSKSPISDRLWLDSTASTARKYYAKFLR